MVDTIAPDQSTIESIFENQIFTGTIDTAGDIDWIKITVSAGVHSFNLIGDPFFGNAITDPVLRLYSSGGSLLKVDDDNGFGSNSYFQYTFAQPGTYYVGISGFSSYTGDYRMTATNGDVGGDTSTQASILPGMSLGGYLEPASPADINHPLGIPDQDWYRIQLVAGRTYTISIEPNPGVDGPNSDPIEPAPSVWASVMDASGTQVLAQGHSVDEGDPADPFQFIPSTSGTYYVVASTPDPYTANYFLSISGPIDVNHRPSGSNKTITIAEDQVYAFTAGDVGYSDVDGHSMYGVRIASLPALGALTYFSSAAHVGDFVWPANLKWTPPANFSGTTSFTFQVRDSAPATSESGFDLDPNTITINVTPVDDAPVINSNGGGDSATVLVTENNSGVATVQATDVDSAVGYFVSGTDAALFKMASNGVLSFKSAPDYEAATDANHDNTYDVTVLATSGALSDTQLMHIILQNAGGATITGGKKSETVDATHKMGGQYATIEEDVINGKAGNDKVNGLRGNDTLTGGKGDDKFVFSAKLGAGNVDTITDFAHGHDKLLLDDAIFKAIGSSLSSAEFYAHSKATKAHDSTDRLIYDTKHGKLYYDNDGQGGHASVLIAVLSHHPTLSTGDFLIA